MNQFKPIEFNEEFANKYWEGPTNMFARYFTYFQRFIGLCNEAKYLLGLFGLGFWKSDLVIPGWVLIIGGLAIIPIGIAIGRWHLFWVQKATEFINTQHGTVNGFNGFNIQVAILNVLMEIKDYLFKK